MYAPQGEQIPTSTPEHALFEAFRPVRLEAFSDNLMRAYITGAAALLAAGADLGVVFTLRDVEGLRVKIVNHTLLLAALSGGTRPTTSAEIKEQVRRTLPPSADNPSGVTVLGGFVRNTREVTPKIGCTVSLVVHSTTLCTEHERILQAMQSKTGWHPRPWGNFSMQVASAPQRVRKDQKKLLVAALAQPLGEYQIPLRKVTFDPEE